MTIISCIPSALPWRYSRVDTNCGNRFVMEKYYYLTGATNNIGKTEGWFAMRKKFQRKTEEFGRPSPLVALMGTVTSGLGAGGAAMGCAMWMICKEHTSQRFMQYSSVAYTGIACMIGCLFAVFTAVASVVMLGFEQDASTKKKKKKKHDDECMTPSMKTMSCAVASFLFSSGSCTAFVCVLGNVLKDFKRTAYYPFAGSHAAPFVGGFGAFLLFISMSIAINRVYQCCGKKKEEEGQDGGYGEGYGAPPGAYGAPPGAYGAYGPPPGGGYGGPPQGGGGYPPQQQW